MTTATRRSRDCSPVSDDGVPPQCIDFAGAATQQAVSPPLVVAGAGGAPATNAAAFPAYHAWCRPYVTAAIGPGTFQVADDFSSPAQVDVVAAAKPVCGGCPRHGPFGCACHAVTQLTSLVTAVCGEFGEAPTTALAVVEMALTDDVVQRVRAAPTAAAAAAGYVAFCAATRRVMIVVTAPSVPLSPSRRAVVLQLSQTDTLRSVAAAAGDAHMPLAPHFPRCRRCCAQGAQLARCGSCDRFVCAPGAAAACGSLCSRCQRACCVSCMIYSKGGTGICNSCF
jgi:hypothetical protein